MASELTSRSTHDTRFVHNIRLWGKEGQEALEKAHILALGCTSVSCQAIKNLVLPGAGAFTLVDDRKITVEEAQTNFFLSNTNGNATTRLGQPLVESAKVTLVDLHRPNDETGGVTGEVVVQNANDFVTSNNGKDFASFLTAKGVNVILISAAVVKESTIAQVAKIVESDAALDKVLVLVLHVSGYIGAIRMASVKDATIVKSVKDSDQTFDTRYSDPFPALRQWMDSHYPEMVEASERTFIPYFVLAYHALISYNEKYVPEYSKKRAERDAKAHNTAEAVIPLTIPNDASEWALAQKCLREEVCTVEVKGTRYTVLDDENETFSDALLLLTRAKGDLKARSVPNLRQVWERADYMLNTQKDKADLYWFVAKAIQTFQKNNNGNLPLSTEIPDFHTDTKWYRELVAIYRAEIEREAQEVYGYVKDLLKEYNKSDADEETVMATCKVMTPYARYLAVTSYVPLSAEYNVNASFAANNNGNHAENDNATTAAAQPSSSTSIAPGVKLSYMPEEGLHDPCGWYIALKVAHKFCSTEGRYPGSINEKSKYEADQRTIAAKYSSDPAECKDVVDTDCNWVTSTENILAQMEEVVRGGGGELITTAAVVGALAAQEVIKYVQQRYIPAGSLIVFDGHEALTHCVGVTANQP